jgi:hypothetical protein
VETLKEGYNYALAANLGLRHKPWEGRTLGPHQQTAAPQVCLVSVQTPPHKVFVCNREYKDTVVCDAVGFLAPTVSHAAFAGDSATRRIVQQAKVRLWIGLDSLLDRCEAEEVEEAWCSAIARLSANVRNPKWAT